MLQAKSSQVSESPSRPLTVASTTPGVLGNHFGEDPAAGSQHSRCLAQGSETIGAVYQVVERAHHEHDVDGIVGKRQATCFGAPGFERCLRPAFRSFASI